MHVNVACKKKKKSNSSGRGNVIYRNSTRWQPLKDGENKIQNTSKKKKKKANGGCLSRPK